MYQFPRRLNTDTLLGLLFQFGTLHLTVLFAARPAPLPRLAPCLRGPCAPDPILVAPRALLGFGGHGAPPFKERRSYGRHYQMSRREWSGACEIRDRPGARHTPSPDAV